jgi:hypothetical protein
MSRRSSFLPIAASIVSLVSGSSCIVIPIPHPSSRYVSSRAAPSMPLVKSFAKGSTSRAEMILALGEPEFELESGRWVVWHWQTCELTLLFGVGGTGAASVGSIDIPNTNRLVARFDKKGFLDQVQHVKGDQFDPTNPAGPEKPISRDAKGRGT